MEANPDPGAVRNERRWSHDRKRSSCRQIQRDVDGPRATHTVNRQFELHGRAGYEIEEIQTGWFYEKAGSRKTRSHLTVVLAQTSPASERARSVYVVVDEGLTVTVPIGGNVPADTPEMVTEADPSTRHASIADDPG